jgi:Lon protease-like protein
MGLIVGNSPDSVADKWANNLRVGLFPLPNVVLFPLAVLPLHIFEERYKAMTADAVKGSRRIAMALYCPGWETNYYGSAAIEPVVCVGTILSHERLEDGRYNLLLRGDARARIVREIPGNQPYRVAELEPLAEQRPIELDLEAQRCKLRRIFCCGPIAGTSVGRQFAKLVASGLPTVDLADLIAFNLLEDPKLKQSFLAEPDGAKRVGRVIDAMELAVPMLAAKLQPSGSGAVNMN